MDASTSIHLVGIPHMGGDGGREARKDKKNRTRKGNMSALRELRLQVPGQLEIA